MGESVDLVVIINDLNNTSKASHEKLLETLLLDGLDDTQANELILSAINEQTIKKYKYAGIDYYKSLGGDNVVTVRDPVEDIASQTDEVLHHKHYISHTEFDEFKDQMCLTVQRLEVEIVKLKSELESRKMDNSSGQHPTNYVDFLQQTITSLIAQRNPPNPMLQPHMNHPQFVFPQPIPQTTLPTYPSAPSLQNTQHTMRLTQRQNQESTHPSASAPAPAPTQQQSSSANAREPHVTANNSQQRDQPKKDIILTGDSMLNGVHEKGLRMDHFVRVRPHPGATSEDMIDFVLPYARQQPDVIALHVSTNDLTKKSNKDTATPKERRPYVNTVQCMKEVFDVIKREAPNTEIVYSLATPRYDKPDMRGRINDINNKMKNLCAQYQIRCIEHKNIDSSCITKPEFDLATGRKTGRKGGGIHPTPKGNNLLASNFLNGFKEF